MTAHQNSFGTSFVPTVDLAEQRKRADADFSLKARRATLPTAVQAWEPYGLTLPELEALAFIQRRFKEAGDTPCTVQRAEVAQVIHATPERAEHMLARLVAAGAVQRASRMAAAPLYRPLPAPLPPPTVDPVPVRPARKSVAQVRVLPPMKPAAAVSPSGDILQAIIAELEAGVLAVQKAMASIAEQPATSRKAEDDTQRRFLAGALGLRDHRQPVAPPHAAVRAALGARG